MIEIREIKRAVLGTEKILRDLGMTNMENQEVQVDNLHQDLNLEEVVEEVVKEVVEDRDLEIEIQKEETGVPKVQQKVVDLVMISLV